MKVNINKHRIIFPRGKPVICLFWSISYPFCSTVYVFVMELFNVFIALGAFLSRCMRLRFGYSSCCFFHCSSYNSY